MFTPRLPLRLQGFALLVLAALLFCAAPSWAQDSPGPVVSMQTNHGEIVIQLQADKAPITVANFMEYVNSGFYEGTVFHRVIEGFMIQGGGYTEDLRLKPPTADSRTGYSRTETFWIITVSTGTGMLGISMRLPVFTVAISSTTSMPSMT